MSLRDRASLRRALPFAALAVLMATFFFAMVDRLASIPVAERRSRLIESDSRHYVNIGVAFTEGRIGDTVGPAHRQPLYGASLAAALALGARTLEDLALVNMVFGIATLAALFWAGRWLFGSWWVGIVADVAYSANEFTQLHIIDQLLTEPLFVLTVVVAAAAAYKYLDASRTRHLVLASAMAGAAYLARPNGAFVFGALWITLLARDLLPHAAIGRRMARAVGLRLVSVGMDLGRIRRRYALALLVFVLVTAPSWVTRIVVYGNPVHHGYLTNYLWVDTYGEGHQSEIIYGPGDYFDSHGLGDVIERIVFGAIRVFIYIPAAYGWSGYLVHAVGMIGMLAAVATRSPSALFLAVVMFVQAAPLVWTALSNPNGRLPYGALLPFLLLFVMFLVDRLRSFVTSDIGDRTGGRAADRPLQVVRIITRLNVGGPAKHVAILGAGLRRRGYETLLLHGLAGDREGSLADLTHGRDLPTKTVLPLVRAVRPWKDLRAFCTIAKAIFVAEPDIVHTHTAKAGVLGRIAALLYNATRDRKRRCLVAHTYHGTVFRQYFGRPGSALVRIVERMLARGTDRFAVLSEQQHREIVDDVRVAPAGKFTRIPLGLDIDPLLRLDADSPTLREELGLADDAIVLGFVGRLVAVKEPQMLLRVFERVAAGAPRVVLLLAGDGTLRAELEALAAELGIAERVRFLGWRHDLPALYATLDVFVLCSRNEGTPVAAIEAMAAARAVVATDVGGVGDVIEHQKTGLVVPAGQPDALAAAMERLVDDAPARQRMGVAARRAAAERFQASRLVDDVDRWYRSGLAAKRGAAVDPA